MTIAAASSTIRAPAGQPPRRPQVRQLAAQHGVRLGLALGGQRRADPRGERHGPAQQAVVGVARPRPPRRAGRARTPAASPASGSGCRSREPVDSANSASIIDASTSRASTRAGVAGQLQVGGELLGGVEGDPVDEHRQVPEQPPLVVGEQLVGPLDGGAQRPVPRRRRWAAPPSRSSARSSRRCRSASENVDSRPAASSMASGMPSRRRTMSATSSQVRGRGRRAGAHPARPGRGTPPPRRTSRRLAARGAAAASGASRKACSRGQAERLAAGRQHASAAGRPPAARRRASRTASSRCSQLSSTQQAGPVAEQRDAGGQDVARDDVQVQCRRERVRDRGRGR